MHRLALLWSILLARGATPAVAQDTYTVFPAVPSHMTASIAQPTNPSTATHVTLDVQDSAIVYVARTLTQQAHLQLGYDTENPQLAKRITVHVAGMGVMDALSVALRGTGLVAKLSADGEMVMIKEQARLPKARLDGGSIVGRVTDSASGAGLGGASIKVEGTKLSAVTSDSGHFTIKGIPSGDQVLSVRLFGYKPAERTVTVVGSEQTTVRIILVPVPTVLSGVVTTAIGQQQRYEVGNDITVLNADSIQQIAPVSTLTDMLETRVPGLIVQHTSGVPGAPSRLRLRGITSINGSSDPIVIIDGIRVYADQSGITDPRNLGVGSSTAIGGGSNVNGFAGPSALDQIDPNSIETAEVLKGPSATAIYGSDAAAGVIVITTKHGHVGPTHWNLSLNEGRTTLPGHWPANYYPFVTNQNTGYPSRSIASSVLNNNLADQYFIPLDSVVAYQALNDPQLSPFTGRAGQTQDLSLTVSGGSGALTYSVTGSASTQSGYLHLPPLYQQMFQQSHGFSAPNWMVTPDQYNTWGGTSQLTVQVGKSGASVSLSSQLFESAQQQSSLQNDLTTLEYTYVDPSEPSTLPFDANYYTRAQLATTTFTNTATLSNWAPWHWLPLTATAGLSVQSNDNNTILPRDYITAQVVNDEYHEYNLPDLSDSLGSYFLSQGTTTTGTLNVGTTLSQRLVNTALGINVYTLGQSNFSASTTGLPIGVFVPTNFVYEDGSGPTYAKISTATYGWYVQPTFNFGNRFFASPGFRLDGGSNSGGSSITGGGNGAGGALSLFPKLDFSWVAVSRPPSNPLFGALTLLRPRIALGIAGVQPGPAEQLRLLEPGQVVPLTTDGSTGTPTDILTLATLGNPQLHPERDRELEGGFDAQFWNQRLLLTLTGYHKMAYDAILQIPVAASVLPSYTSGTINQNVGTIRNTGVEATMFARLLDSRLVDWSVNANLTQTHNLLVSLNKGQPPIVVFNSFTDVGVETRLTPGYPVFGDWALPIIGYDDSNHDGRIEGNEVVLGDSAVYVGDQLPNYELSFSTTFGFLNDRLRIDAAFDYQNGLTQNTSNHFQVANGLLYSPTTTLAQQAALVASEGAGQGAPSTAIGLLQTVNTLRWQSLSITYLLSQHTAHLFRVNNMSVSLQGQNLGLHTNFRGLDPNVNAITNGNFTADDGNELPQPRVWNLRVTLGN